eukprot:6133158-Prymnesium_polylepis.3
MARDPAAPKTCDRREQRGKCHRLCGDTVMGDVSAKRLRAENKGKVGSNNRANSAVAQCVRHVQQPKVRACQADTC